MSIGQARNQQTNWITLSVWSVLVPTLAVCPPHERYRQGDWPVSIASRMQDIDISKAPPRLGAPLPLSHSVRV